MNGFAGNVSIPQGPSPQFTGAWMGANNATQFTNPFVNYAGATAQPAFQAASTVYGNPYGYGSTSPYGALPTAESAAGLGANAAYGTYGMGQGFAQKALSQTLPYAYQVGQTAFDPQNALYARTAQQTQDQVRAAEAARGIQTTPYGAGIEGQTMANFNIDWQNQQLQRQALGGQAIGGLLGVGGQGLQTGANLMTAAPSNLYTSGMLPYSTYNYLGSNQMQDLSTLLGIYGQGQGIANLPFQQSMQLMQGAQGQEQIQNQQAQLALNQSQLGFNQLGQIGQGIGSIAGKLAPYATAMMA